MRILRGTWRAAPWVMVGLDVVLIVASYLFAWAHDVAGTFDIQNVYPNIVVALTFPALGSLILRHAPGNRLGALYLFCGTMSALTIAAFVYPAHGLTTQPPLPASVAVAWVSAWVWLLGVVPLLTLGVLWFPDGRPPTPRWGWCAWPAIGFVLVGVIAEMIRPGPFENHPIHDNPLGIPGARGLESFMQGAGLALLLVALLGSIGALAYRYRAGDQVVRAQVRWLLVAAALVTLSGVLPQHGYTGLASTVIALIAVPLVPLAIGVAVLRHRLLGTDLVVRRSLTYGCLSVSLLAIYVGVVALTHALSSDRFTAGASLVATGLVAVVASPLRSRLQASVDSLVYGSRGDPYAALADLGHRAGAGSPEDLMQDVVVAVAAAVRAPYAAIVLAGEDTATAQTGQPQGPEHRVPLEFRGEEVGELVLSQRTPKDRFNSRDVALLADLGRQVAVTARAAVLSGDLQRSREHLVTTREEERRRIRRDLHDGLGPALAGVAFGIDAARNTLKADPAGTDLMLDQLKHEVQASLADVRRLVYDLRPPALDHLGLAAALEQYAARLAEGGALQVDVEAGQLGVLSAAVEVAAYRIATEALTNSSRHSKATRAQVCLSVSERKLHLSVRDDGVGIGDTPGAGVGLTAMSERAGELGGSCNVTTPNAGGTAVVVVLPIPAGGRR